MKQDEQQPRRRLRRSLPLWAGVWLAVATGVWALVCAWSTEIVIPGREVRFSQLHDLTWDPVEQRLVRTGSDPYAWVDLPAAVVPLRRVTLEFGGRADPAEGFFYLFRSTTTPPNLGLSMVEGDVTRADDAVRVKAELDHSRCLRVDLPDFLSNPLELRRIVGERSFVDPQRWSFRGLVLGAAVAAGMLLRGLIRLQPPVSKEGACATAEDWMGDRVVFGCFAVACVLHFSVVVRNWYSPTLAGHEFRQAQTGISAHFIQQDGDFSLAYPTPVLGRPWSVPFEFPLYQWTVAGLSSATGWPLLPTARLVSLLCFHGLLPALWLLLARAGVATTGRWIVLSLVLTCPLHLLYARAFLIETMALLCALWFLAAFVTAVERRSHGWAMVAAVAGAGAGLVKVTTFIVYLLPAGAGIVLWLWAQRGAWRRQLSLVRRVAAILAVPFAATLWWLDFADRTKARNACAQIFRSGALTEWHFGRLDDRFDPSFWLTYWEHVTKGVMPAGPLLLLLGVAVLLVPARQRAWALGALGMFGGALLVFPRLYAVHDYYYMATAVPLLGACGIGLAGLHARPRLRWAAVVILLGVLAVQLTGYRRDFLPVVDARSADHDVAATLAAITQPAEVLVIAGRDWSSALPYYSRRRALMLRDAVLADEATLERALAALGGERIGAVVLSGGQRQNESLKLRLVRHCDLDLLPLYEAGEDAVFVPRASRSRLEPVMRGLTVPEARTGAAD